MAFLKFIIITIIVLYIIRLLVRLILPVFVQGAVNKMSQQFDAQQRQQRPKKDGSVSIDYMPPQAKTGNTDKLGDFVDFEEVKEK